MSDFSAAWRLGCRRVAPQQVSIRWDCDSSSETSTSKPVLLPKPSRASLGFKLLSTAKWSHRNEAGWTSHTASAIRPDADDPHDFEGLGRALPSKLISQMGDLRPPALADEENR
jgi:hypothetical protein